MSKSTKSRPEKPPVAPQQRRDVKDMSTAELGLMLGVECGRIIQAQGVIQEAQTNVNSLRIELELRQKAKEKEGKNDGEKR